jgi:protein gp37
MGATTNIEWTEATWNPVSGCTEVSPGCDHCYAKSVAERFRGTQGHYYEHGFDVTLRPDKLDLPLRWTKPKRIFVNSMSDLFHDQVPDEYIARVFAVMALAPQHTFQLLTKRHGRMRSLLGSDDFPMLVRRAMREFEPPVNHLEDPDPADGGNCGNCAAGVAHASFNWPLRNVWLGVSVENQQWADIRIPALLDTPAAVRFLSMEPLLGPVDLAAVPRPACTCGERPLKITAERSLPVHRTGCPATRYPWPDWVIVGGESGRGARPMHPGWARSLREQCTAAGVPFLFKQWGEWAPSMGRVEHQGFVWNDGRLLEASSTPIRTFAARRPRYVVSSPPDAPGWVNVERVGKKAAGRELDGATWDQFPGGEG